VSLGKEEGGTRGRKEKGGRRGRKEKGGRRKGRGGRRRDCYMRVETNQAANMIRLTLKTGSGDITSVIRYGGGRNKREEEERGRRKEEEGGVGEEEGGRPTKLPTRLTLRPEVGRREEGRRKEEDRGGRRVQRV
jgi:hypothetical protein